MIIIALVIGLVVAFVGTGVLRSQLKSVKWQESAAMYETERLSLSNKRDIFLYRRVTKIPKPKNDNHGPGGPRH